MRAAPRRLRRAARSDRDKVCLPKGVDRERPGSVQAGILVGAWHQSTKTFDFTCSTSYPGNEGETMTLSVNGKLKLK